MRGGRKIRSAVRGMAAAVQPVLGEISPRRKILPAVQSACTLKKYINLPGSVLVCTLVSKLNLCLHFFGCGGGCTEGIGKSNMS